METHYSTAADPPEIRNKLASLQCQKVIIEDLTLRLQNAQTEYKRLETEIKAYRASVAPIQKCPEEVLLMIFQAYSKQNPALVTHLIPVCHRWHDVAVNAPGLWSYINIRSGRPRSARTWDLDAQAALATQMIRTCLKYSASVPLHIELDCRNLESAASQLNEYLIHCLQEIDPSKDRYYISEYMELADLDLTLLTIDVSRLHPDHAIESIYELIGTRGKHMKRWGSLKINLPESDPEGTLGRWIWRLFNHPAPNLVKLSVFPTPSLPKGGIPGKGCGFSDLSSLQVLELFGSELSDLDFLPLKFDSIKCLALDIDAMNLHQSLNLSRFTNLEKLVLRCYDDFEGITSGTISLPSLKSLSLLGYSNLPVRWNVPILQLLEFGGYMEPTPVWLPELQVVHVLLGDHLLDSEHRETQSRIHEILSKYPTMQQLTLPTELRSSWEVLVQELTRKQELPLVLPVVLFATVEVEYDRYF